MSDDEKNVLTNYVGVLPNGTVEMPANPLVRSFDECYSMCMGEENRGGQVIRLQKAIILLQAPFMEPTLSTAQRVSFMWNMLGMHDPDNHVEERAAFIEFAKEIWDSHLFQPFMDAYEVTDHMSKNNAEAVLRLSKTKPLTFVWSFLEDTYAAHFRMDSQKAKEEWERRFS